MRHLLYSTIFIFGLATQSFALEDCPSAESVQEAFRSVYKEVGFSEKMATKLTLKSSKIYPTFMTGVTLDHNGHQCNYVKEGSRLLFIK